MKLNITKKSGRVSNFDHLDLEHQIDPQPCSLSLRIVQDKNPGVYIEYLDYSTFRLILPNRKSQLQHI